MGRRAERGECCFRKVPGDVSGAQLDSSIEGLKVLLPVSCTTLDKLLNFPLPHLDYL